MSAESALSTPRRITSAEVFRASMAFFSSPAVIRLQSSGTNKSLPQSSAAAHSSATLPLAGRVNFLFLAFSQAPARCRPSRARAE